MGLFKTIAAVVGTLVLAFVFLGSYLWFTDYEAKATVTERGQDAGGRYVVITPDLYPAYAHKAYLTGNDAEAWNFICQGYVVHYRIQTQHYTVFDAAGALVYDSQEGLQDVAALARCGASNTGGGIFG